jgi:hypothetical protein
MSNLKVMKHTTYKLTGDRLDSKRIEELRDYHEEIPVVFNRDGSYLQSDKCWFEVNGKAYKMNSYSFRHNMRQLEMGEVPIDLVTKLKHIMRLYPSALSKQQLQLIQDYKLFLELRDITRKSRVWRRNFIAKCKDKLNG